MKKMLPSAKASGPLDVTEAAIAKIREYQSEHADYEGKAFRVRVDGGGCAGFRYAFEFDDPEADDVVFEADGVKLAIDPATLPLVSGSVLDFHSSLMASGFVVTNPNSSATCGCGMSFGV
jgi:iron-sulfur cluster assembly accessory protein